MARQPRAAKAQSQAQATKPVALEERLEARSQDVAADVSEALGVTVTPEVISQAQEEIDVLNLDELDNPLLRVAIMERFPEEVTLPDGTRSTRYVARPRTAELYIFPSVQTQLKAMSYARDRKKMTLEAQVDAMLALLLEIWQESEPDMTKERLLRGLDMARISKLFQLLFTQATRQ